MPSRVEQSREEGAVIILKKKQTNKTAMNADMHLFFFFYLAEKLFLSMGQ